MWRTKGNTWIQIRLFYAHQHSSWMWFLATNICIDRIDWLKQNFSNVSCILCALTFEWRKFNEISTSKNLTLKTTKSKLLYMWREMRWTNQQFTQNKKWIFDRINSPHWKSFWHPNWIKYAFVCLCFCTCFKLKVFYQD